jgi:hypothetical protein
MRSLSDFARLVLDLCRWRRGPQDLPYSPNLLALLIGASVALDLLLASVLHDTDNILARSLLSTAIVLGLCWIALALRSLRNRYVQAATALVACGMLFSLLQLPLAWLAGPAPATAASLSPLQVLLGWLMLALLVWKLSVDAHIMRHAMEAPYGLAFALVTAWLIAYWALDRAWFGAAE